MYEITIRTKDSETAEEILSKAMEWIGATYQLRYVDTGDLTVPVLITEDRIKKIISDCSIEEIIVNL